MKITVVSNYINHHQIPLAEEMYASLGLEYAFLETEPMEEERVKMGWNANTDSLPFLHSFLKEREFCERLVDESDVVIFGGCDDESYIEKRLAEKKPVIRISERIYKSGQWKAISPRGLKKKYHDHTSHKLDPVILLCAGAYVPSDFSIIHAYKDKMFRWGYFPPFIKQDLEALMASKGDGKAPVKLLWAGRQIGWKHPMDALLVAKRLKEEGIPFHLTMIGDGECHAELVSFVGSEAMADYVSFIPFLKPEEVRLKMEESDIFLFTSDYLEGWGAVLNEAMNSGCAVVANVAAGATGYLIEDGENGFAYRNGDLEELYRTVSLLATDAEQRKKCGRKAYETIAEEWNARMAAKSLLSLCKSLVMNTLTGVNITTECEQGPGSRAKVIPVRKMYEAVKTRNV